MFACNLISQNLCPNLQKPPRPSKIPGCAPELYQKQLQQLWRNLASVNVKILRLQLTFFAFALLTHFQPMFHFYTPLQQIPHFRVLVLTFTLFSDAGRYDGKKSKTRKKQMKTIISFFIW